MTRVPRFVVAAVVCAAAFATTAAFATDIVLIEVGPLIRKFPEGFCPLPISLTFTSQGTSCKFYAEANTYVDDGSSLVYTRQAIDNVALVPTAVHNANSVANDGTYQFCYEDVSVPTVFLFDQVSPASVPMVETFEQGSGNWDLSEGAYYDNTRSAHSDPSSGNPTAGVGCLGIGQETQSPSLNDFGRTSITIDGLTDGASYTLSGWWIVGDGIFTGNATLKLKVTAESTPTAQRSWGRLKITYR
jgi:hypothetical protein